MQRNTRGLGGGQEMAERWRADGTDASKEGCVGVKQNGADCEAAKLIAARTASLLTRSAGIRPLLSACSA